MNEFLKLEYEKCMELVKYYDERHHGLMKFATGLTSAVPTLLLGIYGLSNKTEPMFWDMATFIFLVSTISLISMLAAITQTRLYFVYPARQLNAIRRDALQTVAKDFTNNQMYLDTSFSPFKWNSSHTVQQAMIALQIGLFAGLSMFAWNFATLVRAINIYTSSIVAIITAVTVFFASAAYLHSKGQLHPDKAVHQREE